MTYILTDKCSVCDVTVSFNTNSGHYKFKKRNRLCKK